MRPRLDIRINIYTANKEGSFTLYFCPCKHRHLVITNLHLSDICVTQMKPHMSLLILEKYIQIKQTLSTNRRD